MGNDLELKMELGVDVVQKHGRESTAGSAHPQLRGSSGMTFGPEGQDHIVTDPSPAQ